MVWWSISSARGLGLMLLRLVLPLIGEMQLSLPGAIAFTGFAVSPFLGYLVRPSASRPQFLWSGGQFQVLTD